MTDFRALCAKAVELWDADCDMDGVIDEMRAALAEPQPPAGDAGELVAWLHGQDGGLGKRAVYSRIADLLERLAQDHVADASKMVEPIPVAERLPEAGDCDAEGRCWWFVSDAEEDFAWERLENTELRRGWSHWLPVHALPLPSGDTNAQPNSQCAVQ